MKKLLLAAALWLAPFAAFAQCTGVFPANTLCGNLGATPAPPSAFSASTAILGPGTSTVGHFATWANTTGNQLADFDLFGNNSTWTGTNTFSAAATFNANANFTSTFQIGGATKTFPTGAATLAGLGTNQTFTGNNTFSTGTTNVTGTFQLGGTTLALPVTVPNGGTGNATAAVHTIPLNQGTSSQTNTGTGTVGQCIVSAGAGADPAFTGGCWTLLNTITASNSATMSDTTSLTSTYSSYLLVFQNILPATNGVSLELQVHSGGVFQNTSYLNASFSWNQAGSGINTPNTFIILSGSGNAANTAPGWSGQVSIQTPSSTTITKMWTGQMGGAANASTMGGVIVNGFWSTSTAAIDGFQVLASSGNITSGTIKVYGRP